MNHPSYHKLGPSRVWRPYYGVYNMDRMLARLGDIAACGIGDNEALMASETFIRKVFNDFRSRSRQYSYGFAFAVPTRISREHDSYKSEVAHFLPIVDALDAPTRQLFISDLPPCIIDEYRHPTSVAHGAVLFVPLFIDMVHDIRNKIALAYKARMIVKDTAQFARDRLGADIVGLGAILPKLTGFGRQFQRYGLITTTGHGGTVYLIYKTYTKICDEYGFDQSKPVGCIGAGAIGEASADILLSQDPRLKLVLHDKREGVQNQVVSRLRLKYGPRITGLSSNDEVLNASSVIISAITTRIHIGQSVDLTGKIIIDDSQPSSFYPSEIDKHGGRIVWVVGHDNSEDRFLTRRSGYRFGEEGLLEVGDVWGCEAEVGSLWKKGMLNLALNEPVTPDKALAIGRVMDEYGIEIAKFQHNGRATFISKNKK